MKITSAISLYFLNTHLLLICQRLLFGHEDLPSRFIYDYQRLEGFPNSDLRYVSFLQILISLCHSITRFVEVSVVSHLTHSLVRRQKFNFNVFDRLNLGIQQYIAFNPKLFSYQTADDKIFVCKFSKKFKSKLYNIENTKTRGQIM